MDKLQERLNWGLCKHPIPLISISVAVAAINICMVVMGIKQTTVSVALNSIVLGMGIDYPITSRRGTSRKGKNSA